MRYSTRFYQKYNFWRKLFSNFCNRPVTKCHDNAVLRLEFCKIVLKQFWAAISVSFRSFSSPEVHTHLLKVYLKFSLIYSTADWSENNYLNGPKPKEKISPMTSCIYEGYLKRVLMLFAFELDMFSSFKARLHSNRNALP